MSLQEEATPVKVIVDGPHVIYQMEVEGNPSAMARPRHRNGNTYNPSERAVTQFRNKVFGKLSLELIRTPVFRKEKVLTVTVWHFMRRPNDDFVGRVRSPGNLRGDYALDPYLPIKPDIDNLAKFVLDALNGPMFEDDRQVVKLVNYKRRDNKGMCEGRTVIRVSEFMTDREDVDTEWHMASSADDDVESMAPAV